MWVQSKKLTLAFHNVLFESFKCFPLSGADLMLFWKHMGVCMTQCFQFMLYVTDGMTQKLWDTNWCISSQTAMVLTKHHGQISLYINILITRATFKILLKHWITINPIQHTYMNGWISQYIWVSWKLSKRASCKSAKTSNKQLETRQHVMSVRIQIPSSTSSSSSIVVHLCASSTSMLLELFRANLCILWTIAMACINCCGETNSSLMFTPQRLLLCSLPLSLTAFKTHTQCLQILR